MKIWQRISLALIALVLCVSLLGLEQLGGGWMRQDALQLDTWAGYLDVYSAAAGPGPRTLEPNVSWNSRMARLFGGSQPDVSWNSRMAFAERRQPNVSWNS